MWNAYSFLRLYSSKQATWSVDSDDVLDRFILAKTRDLVEAVDASLSASDISAACDEIRVFCDVLTNWYVRRSRDRFWAGDDQYPEAFNTLYTVLETLCRVAAPLLPMTTEVIWRGLTGERSVHLTDYPVAQDFPADDGLVRAMDLVRAVCSSASSIRKAAQLRNRLPLNKLTVAVPEADSLAEFAPVIRDEVNVKNVELTTDVDAVGSFKVNVIPKVAAPRLGRDFQQTLVAVKKGDYERDGDTVKAAGQVLQPGEYEEVLVAADPDSTARISGHNGLVVLDKNVTEELEAEGWAADVIRGLQDARKAEDFEVSDRISVRLQVSEDKAEWANRFAEHIAEEVLATVFAFTDATGEHEIIDGVTATLKKNN